MKENQKKAFDFASETTKQLITIATAIITLTVTFSKEIIGGAENAPRSILVWTWAVFILSIIFGICTLMTLTGTLQPLAKWSTYKKNKQNQQKDLSEDSELPASSQSTSTPDDDCTEININVGNIRLFSILQAGTFIVAIILTGYFGYKSLAEEKIRKEKVNTYPIIRRSFLNNDTTNIYTDTLYLMK